MSFVRPGRFSTPKALLAALLLAGLGAAPPVQAWGRGAHRIVADLAQAQLQPAASAEVTRLLGPESTTQLADVANWADDLKQSGGDAARSTRRWHFVDFGDGGCEYVPARDCPDGNCIVAAINRQFLRLADRRRSDEERLEALKFLVHLVADVHQPLHSTPMDDKGGQQFQVAWHGKPRNLHGAWDFLVIDRAMQVEGLDEAGYEHWLQARPPLPADPTRRSDRPAVDWAQESCRIVRDGKLYPPTHILGDDYLDAHRGQAEQQLRLAASRLADMLNFALGPPRASGSR